MSTRLVARLKRCTRRSPRAAVAIVAGSVGLLAFGNAGGATMTTSGPTPGIGVQRLGGSYPYGSAYDRYSYVEVGIANAAAAGALSTTSLVYTSGTSVPTNWTSGVPYADALANGWLLKDAQGNYVMNAQYGRYIGDFGNPAYQQSFITWVSNFLAQNHNKGVEIDDTICDALQLTGGVYPAKYPNQQAWEDAQVSFISAVGDALRARGYYVMANATCFIRGNLASNDGSLTAAFWKRLAPHVSGLCSEYWQQLASQPSVIRLAGTDDWQYHWEGWQKLIEVAQQAGADFFTEMYGTSDSANSTRIMRYGKASFLLDWDGSGGAFMYLPYGATDPWNLEWTMDVGVPLGPKYQVGVGWRRDYSDGMALLNANRTTTQQFTLGGTFYEADGTAATSVTLGPGEAIVLQGSSFTPLPPTDVTVPQALTLPSISGVARVGNTLTADTGEWLGPPDCTPTSGSGAAQEARSART